MNNPNQGSSNHAHFLMSLLANWNITRCIHIHTTEYWQFCVGPSSHIKHGLIMCYSVVENQSHMSRIGIHTKFKLSSTSQRIYSHPLHNVISPMYASNTSQKPTFKQKKLFSFQSNLFLHVNWAKTEKIFFCEDNLWKHAAIELPPGMPGI